MASVRSQRVVHHHDSRKISRGEGRKRKGNTRGKGVNKHELPSPGSLTVVCGAVLGVPAGTRPKHSETPINGLEGIHRVLVDKNTGYQN